MSLRILWVLPYLPWPTSSGGKTRQFNLLRALARAGHRITLLVQSKVPLDDEARQVLEPLLEQLIVLRRRPLRSPTTLLTAALSPLPMLASINGHAPGLSRRFSELLKQPWDVVQIEHSYSFQPYEQVLRQTAQSFILTEHNVESALGGAIYDRFPTWLRPMVWFDQWRYRRWERHVMTLAAQVVAVTEADARALGAISGRHIPVVVNGVDCARYAAVTPAYDDKRLLFIGNYEYPPNVDAVEWAMGEVMPRVWQLQPEARITIAGYALPAEWPQRWPDERIEWHAFVPDLTALQSQAAIFFAPLRTGGGSKLKVLEAMAAGLAVVTTAQGVSGLAVTAGCEYDGGENAEALADAISRQLDDSAALQRMGAAGRAYVCRAHDWSVAARQLLDVYATIGKPEELACE